jgi:hypothetical protein
LVENQAKWSDLNEDGDPTNKKWNLSNTHVDLTKKNVDSRNQNMGYLGIFK